MNMPNFKNLTAQNFLDLKYKLATSADIFFSFNISEILGNNGKYWSVTGDGSIAINATTPEYFIIELVQHSRLIIRPENSEGYLVTDKVTGALTAKGNRDDPAALWEY